jgi:amidase
MTAELWRWSAGRIAAAVAAGEIAPAAAGEAAAARMAAVNERVNAVTVDLSAEAISAAADAAPGPLQGVPVTIKENTDQKGLANANGVPAFTDNIAPDDAPLVANLKGAGAVVLGRTNTPEFSLRWSTDNPLRGPTANPWNPGRTPGGSSGGAAAAVALGIGAIAHGNDLGGSLRYPAYCCGVATIRPSLGRVPAYNPSAADERPPSFQLMSVQGPIARTVADVRLGLSVMMRGDARDPWWTGAPLEGPPEAGPIRVAVTKSPADLTCHPAVAQAIDEAAGHLEKAGYVVEEADPPGVAEIAACWRDLLATDAEVMMGESIRANGSADIQAVFDGFLSGAEALGLRDYVQRLALRTRHLRDWALFQEDYPLVLAPVSQEPPFPMGDDLLSAARRAELLQSQTLLYAVNLLALPSAAVPTGLHEATPMGVQLIGRRFREDQCLDAAEAIEREVGVLAERLWERG